MRSALRLGLAIAMVMVVFSSFVFYYVGTGRGYSPKGPWGAMNDCGNHVHLAGNQHNFQPEKVDLNGSGYILELHASDQLTGGGMNLLSLQCLAGRLGKAVLVEPFEVHGTFGVQLSGDEVDFARDNNVRLSDIYNMEQWNAYTDKRGYRRLASWEDFLQYAPRDVILVLYA